MAARLGRLKNRGLPEHEPFAWRLAKASDGALYLVIARRSERGEIGNELDGALYRSTDRAETWEKVNLPEGVNGPNGLAVDPENPRRLYLAAWAPARRAQRRHLTCPPIAAPRGSTSMTPTSMSTT